jgi:hypothetical protein
MEERMKLAKLWTLSAAALLVSTGLAAAQGTGSSMSGSDASKCWDAATNQIKDKSTTGSTASSSSPTTGSTTSGTGSSNTGSSMSGSTSGSTAATKPAGMPNC